MTGVIVGGGFGLFAAAHAETEETEMPAYRIDHPEFAKPRAVEVRDPRAARAFVARELKVTKLSSRAAFDLSKEGVELVVLPGKGAA